MAAEELTLLLAGVDLDKTRRRQWWRPGPSKESGKKKRKQSLDLSFAVVD
jgi:hypothetical protein